MAELVLGELDSAGVAVVTYPKFAETEFVKPLLGSVDLPARAAPGAWADQVAAALWSYTGVLFQYPSMARSALVSRPSGPNYLAIVEYLLSVMEDGGVAAGQRAWGVDVLLLHATAQAVEHAESSRSPEASREDQELAAAIGGAPPARYPAVAALSEELLTGTPRQRHDWGVKALLSGIAQTPLPTDLGQPDAEETR